MRMDGRGCKEAKVMMRVEMLLVRWTVYDSPSKVGWMSLFIPFICDCHVMRPLVLHESAVSQAFHATRWLRLNF
jgi:hypothetical protein